MVLLTGEGLDGLGAVRFGSTEAETFALSSNAVVVRVPDGLQPGCFPIRLGNDGPSADFEVLAETPFGDWEAPDFGLAPRPVPVGYINPIDDFWTNEFDQSDVYFLQIPGDREASVVAFENVEPQPGDEPGNVINGTFDRITGLFRMDVEKANGVTVQFVGVHSETGNESEGFYRLVLFPDAPSGPQLVLTVGSPPEPDTGLQRRF